jgi:signal transduction histidine kinase
MRLPDVVRQCQKEEKMSVNKKVDKPLSFRRYTIALAVVWTVIVGVSLVWNIWHEYPNAIDQGRIRAVEALSKDMIFREWVAGHGGVYVPITEDTPPNPDLSHIAERDIRAPSGMELTLVNPAYMTRQVHELGREEYGIHGRITSLKPVRAENAPDSWERKALEAIHGGEKEVYSIEQIGGESFMCLMRPFVTEERCLKCHSAHGYKVGDIRGGISVAVPMAPQWAIASSHTVGDLLTHCLVWLLGVFGVVAGGRKIERQFFARRKAEDKLRISHERFSAVMDSLDALVYVADMETYELLYVNKYGRDIWGDVVGQTCWKALQSGQGGACEFCTNDGLVDAGGAATGIYVWELQNTVNREWYECRDQAIRWTDGRLVRMEIATNITERKRSETEREWFVNSLSEKTKEMESLLRIVTHDLRSPLVNIQGFSHELEAGFQQITKVIDEAEMDNQTKENISAIANEEISESLEFITAGIEKMDSLVESLSRLSKIGRVELHIETLNMDKMLADIVNTIQFEAKERDTAIVVEPLPDCQGDVTQINQVFANLVGNALKYLDPERKGSIRITGWVEESRSVYCVEDNGIGIAEEHKDKVFEIFHRVDPEGQVSGEGLGLTTVKQILSRQDGNTWFDSKAGKGSRFYVGLPVSKDSSTDGKKVLLSSPKQEEGK